MREIEGEPMAVGIQPMTFSSENFGPSTAFFVATCVRAPVIDHRPFRVTDFSSACQGTMVQGKSAGQGFREDVAEGWENRKFMANVREIEIFCND